MTVQRTRRRRGKPEHECQHASCHRNKMEASKTDAWSQMGLCTKHVEDAVKFLSNQRSIFYNA